MPRENPESEEDFIAMQQEAIRRVREMQQRARDTLENAGMHIESGEPNRGGEVPNETARSEANRSGTNRGEANRDEPNRSGTNRSEAGHGEASRNGTNRSEASHGEPTRNGTNREEPPLHGNFPGAPPPNAARHSNVPHGGAPSGEPPHSEPAHGEPDSPPPSGPAGGLFSLLGPSRALPLENDQIILLVLLYLLFRDNGDRMLLLALAYIFL